MKANVHVKISLVRSIYTHMLWTLVTVLTSSLIQSFLKEPGLPCSCYFPLFNASSTFSRCIDVFRRIIERLLRSYAAALNDLYKVT